MLSTLTVVLPVFGLILAGYLARKWGALGPGSASELTRFVVYLALPAMLFDIITGARLKELWQPGFIGAFGGGCAIVFAVTWVLRKRQGHSPADAAVDSLTTSYANTGFMGFPLSLLAFGPSSQPPTTISAIISVCVVFGFAIVLVEMGLQSELDPRHALMNALRSLSRNPLLIAPVLGILFAFSGLTMPAVIESFIKLLSGASSPCALVSLGAFLAGQRLRGSQSSAFQLVALKLFLHPAATWILAYYVFAMPKAWAQMAVLLAALPTGTGSFMVAELYEREAATTSAAVLYSTIGSLVTVTLYLLWIKS